MESDLKKILIVDDEVLSAELLATFLKSIGYSVCEIATTGNKAIQIAQSDKPDFVLMDLRLAGEMDGAEAMKAILEINPGTPFAFISGYPDEVIQKKSINLSPVEVFTKPFTFDFNNIATFLNDYFKKLP